jgi:hypothetical protein
VAQKCSKIRWIICHDENASQTFLVWNVKIKGGVLKVKEVTVPIEMVDPKKLIQNPQREYLKTLPDKKQGRFLMIRDSIIVNGVKQPLLVRRSDQMILGGHTRCEIAVELELPEVPVQYVEVDDDEALYLVIEDNLDHAEDEEDVMKIARQCQELKRLAGRKQGRPKKTDPGDVFFSDNIAEKLNMSDITFRRYVILNRLISPLQNLVSTGNIGVKSGAILAKLSKKNQKKVYESIKSRAFSKTYRMKEVDADGYRKAFTDQEKVEGDDELEIVSTEELTEGLIEDDYDFYVKKVGNDEDISEEEDNNDVITYQNMEQNALKKLMIQGNADILESSYDIDKVIFLSAEDQKHRIGATQRGAQEKMEALLSIEDPDARRKFSVSKVKSTVRAHQLAVERAEVELITELATLAPDDYEDVEEQWGNLTQAFERAAKKFELALEKLRANHVGK